MIYVAMALYLLGVAEVAMAHEDEKVLVPKSVWVLAVMLWPLMVLCLLFELRHERD